jgi:hypothetical protein
MVMVSSLSNVSFHHFDPDQNSAARMSLVPSIRNTLTVNVGLQLVDGKTLLVDDTLHEIADRNDANHAPTTNNRQMPYAFPPS